jgi:hypothetical protein
LLLRPGKAIIVEKLAFSFIDLAQPIWGEAYPENCLAAFLALHSAPQKQKIKTPHDAAKCHGNELLTTYMVIIDAAAVRV